MVVRVPVLMDILGNTVNILWKASTHRKILSQITYWVVLSYQILTNISDLWQVGVFSWYSVSSTNKTDCHDMYMLSGSELIDAENISLPSQNMKFGGEWAKRTSHKLHILSSRLIFFSINHIHIQMTCLSSLN